MAVLLLICFSFLVVPVFSEQPDEEEILISVQNLSLEIPPTGSAPYGTKESMMEYQSWLEACSCQIMNYSNMLLEVFGLPAFDWPSGSGSTNPSPTPHTATATTNPEPPPPTTRPLMKPGYGLTTIATITGESGRKTTSVQVPYGYWELWYTVDPLITGAQDSHSATGSNSAVFPVLKMVITESGSNKKIETVEPPGGLDITLWQRAGDPRPWSKKFYQGNKEFTFDITARHIKSYAIEIRVRTSDYSQQPETYPG